MGCLTKLGCMGVAVVGIGALAYVSRNSWLPDDMRSDIIAEPKASDWQAPSYNGAKRTRDAIESLGKPNGPEYVTLEASDAASFVVDEISKRLPGAADSIETKVVGDQISMRARINIDELKDTKLGGKLGSQLGAIGGLLESKEHVEITGSLGVAQPGVGTLNAKSIKIHGLPMPSAMLSTLTQKMSASKLPAGVNPQAIAAGQLPFPLPKSIGDIRAQAGKFTLYKAHR